MRKTSKIQEFSLVDQLVEAIRDAIVNGQLEPGSHIVIKKLADTYGTSMIPVREALARLLSSRLVRVENNRGYFVAAKPSAAEFRQFVDARELFETSVIGMGFDNAAPRALRTLRALNTKMEKAAQSGKRNRLAQWSSLNSAFHQTLIGLARNTYLSNQYEDLSLGNLHLQLVMSYPLAFDDLQTLVEQHETMIDALEAQDRATFFQTLAAHIRFVKI
ncbi:MAG: GntR family transcriptional regulator [Pseudomonadota bacterium]